MKAQDSQFQMQFLGLAGALIKQNSQVLQQNNQLIQHLADQDNHLVNLGNQISELLLMLEEQEEADSPRYLDE